MRLVQTRAARPFMQDLGIRSGDSSPLVHILGIMLPSVFKDVYSYLPFTQSRTKHWTFFYHLPEGLYLEYWMT